MEHINNILKTKGEVLKEKEEALIEVQVPNWIKKGWTGLPNKIIIDTSISHDSRFLYLTLQMHGMKTTTCFPSYKTLQKEIGISYPSISKYLKELINKRWIKISRKKNGKVNVYHLLKY